MTRKIITFLGKEYKTQKEFEQFVKNLIYNEIGNCEDIKKKYPVKYEILIEVLKRHPEYQLKIKNMIKIKIEKDTLNKSALKILIINFDLS